MKKSIFEKVNSLAAVYEMVKPTDDQKILLNYSGTDRKMIGAQNSMLSEMITEAMSEGWKPSPGDRGYFPVFNDSNGGFAFSYSGYGDWYSGSGTGVGSRFVFETPEKSKHAAITFPQVFKEKFNK